MIDFRSPSLREGQPSPLNDSQTSLYISGAGGNSTIAEPSAPKRKVSPSTDDVSGITYNFHSFHVVSLILIVFIRSTIEQCSITQQEIEESPRRKAVVPSGNVELLQTNC